MNLGPTVPFGTALALWLLFAWTMIWKAIAIWRAAQSHQRNWFIAMLVLGPDTLGVLEIVYLFAFAKKRLKLEDIKTWFTKTFSSKPQ